jgi:hypothetical protein
MKTRIISSILALLVSAGITATAQNRPDEYLGLPGDNLNLYAVMKLFQNSETLEGFERSLNDEASRINNLDLNGDNLIDYIMVTDYVDRDVHTIVLQVALNRNEKQDVAVFTVQRFSNKSVQIQLIGDAALYGNNYIVEPIYDDNSGETANPGYIGSTYYTQNITVVRTTPYEIAAWPLIRFIYLPHYVCWHSSWYWGYYPSYWHPWRPFYWDYYYGYHYNWYNDYYSHYRHCDHFRYTRYNDFYYSSIRSHSPQVSHRIMEGSYKTTYSHPEQRRDGEALYSRMHSGRNSGVADNNTINSRDRRSSSESTRARTITGNNSGTERRTINSGTTRSKSNPSLDQNAGTSRRSYATAAERSSSSTYSGRNDGGAHRSINSVTVKSGENRSSGKDVITSHRSSAPSASRSFPDNRRESAGSSRQSQSRESASNHRNIRESNSQNSANRKSDTKGSENDRSARRK